MRRQISWTASGEDQKLIDKCAARAGRALSAYDLTDAQMDLTACHANGCPLDLAKLLAADDFTFLHDVAGIRRHLNRNTGRLSACFLPRCAKTAGVPR